MKLTSVQRRLSEDYHGGDVQHGGQFPTHTLERSQTHKGPGDQFVHDDPGQAGKTEKFIKPKKRKRRTR